MYLLRSTNNIKRARARVSREEVKDFFNHFAVSVEGVPPENLFNYDETALRDDPGSSKCIFKKGSKYCERVMNTSKQSFSVMFCGSAAGVMMPPMVVYKAQNRYPSWEEYGPKGTVYSCSKSGWFDGPNFEMWFFQLALPHLKRLVGKKLLIGDNLSSHISNDVIQACNNNQIEFVCLPPNSTDKLQPLDVGVFRSLKGGWRGVVTNYKEKNPKLCGIRKSDFPSLLADLLRRVNIGKHLPAAFKACGLCPLSLEKAVRRIPSRDMETANETTRELLNSTLGETLEALRGLDAPKNKPRGKKIKVPPGKSYCTNDEEEEREEEEEEEADFDLYLDSPVAPKTKKKTFFTDSFDSPDSSEDEDDGLVRKAVSEYSVGEYVVAIYDQDWFIAQVEGEEPENECDGFTLLKYMIRKGKNQFVWEEDGKADLLKTINSDILLKVETPIPVTNRFFGLQKDLVKKVETLFRVKWFTFVTNIFRNILISLQNFKFI